MTSKKQHLHPISLVFDFAHDFKQLLFPAIFVFSGIRKLSSWLFVLPLTLMILSILIFFIFTLISYFKFTYEITTDHLRINSGVFERKKLFVPYERIQTIKTKQWFFLKPFKLISLAIETAGNESGKAEINLRAVPETTLMEIKTFQKQHPLSSQQTPPPEQNGEKDVPTDVLTPDASLQLSTHDLLIYGLTALGILPGLLAFLSLFERFDNLFELIPTPTLPTDAKSLATLGILMISGIVLAVLVLSIFVSLLLVQIRYYHFSLLKQKNNLIISKGLFQRSEISVDLGRIQALKMEQQLLRRLFGLVTISAITATETGDEGGNRAEVVLIPVTTQQKHLKQLHLFFEKLPLKIPILTELPARNKWYFLRFTLLWSVVPASLLSYFGRPWGFLVWLLVLGLLINDFLKFKNTGYRLLSSQTLLLQESRGFQRTAFFLEKNKIQSLSFRQSYWMHKKNTYHLTAVIKSGSTNRKVPLRYLPADSKEKIEQWYSN